MRAGGVRAGRRVAGVTVVAALAVATLVVGASAQAATTWSEQELVPSDGQLGDNFGESVAASGGRIVVGARTSHPQQEPGAAYVYEDDGAGGYDETKLVSSDGADQDQQWFGASVDVSGDRVVVGAPNDDERGASAGAAYVFESDGSGGWVETKLMSADSKTTSPVSVGRWRCRAIASWWGRRTTTKATTSATSRRGPCTCTSPTGRVGGQRPG